MQTPQNGQTNSNNCLKCWRLWAHIFEGNTITLNPIMASVHKIAKHTLQIFQQMLQHFKRVFDHFVVTIGVKRLNKKTGSIKHAFKQLLLPKRVFKLKAIIPQHGYQLNLKIKSIPFSSGLLYCSNCFDIILNLLFKGVILFLGIILSEHTPVSCSARTLTPSISAPCFSRFSSSS